MIINEEKKKENSRKLAYEQIFFTWKSLWEAIGANFKFGNISYATALYADLTEISFPDKYPDNLELYLLPLFQVSHNLCILAFSEKLF